MGLKDHSSCRILPREFAVSLGPGAVVFHVRTWYAGGVVRGDLRAMYSLCQSVLSTRTSAQVGRDVGPSQIAEKIIRSDAECALMFPGVTEARDLAW